VRRGVKGNKFGDDVRDSFYLRVELVVTFAIPPTLKVAEQASTMTAA
jgi:hypothetical protein